AVSTKSYPGPALFGVRLQSFARAAIQARCARSQLLDRRCAAPELVTRRADGAEQLPGRSRKSFLKRSEALWPPSSTMAACNQLPAAQHNCVSSPLGAQLWNSRWSLSPSRML